MKLVIATTNKNKIIEIKDIFGDLSGLKILSLNDFQNYPDVHEDGNSFEENALKKAKLYCVFTGFTTLSEDSGLEINALGGEPGIHSHRYAGDNSNDDRNIDLVLKKLEGIPDVNRNARFISCIALVYPDGKEYSTKGICEGRIIHTRIGKSGFGYDPIFYLPELKKTMAELSIKEKNKISHRAKALAKVIGIIKENL